MGGDVAVHVNMWKMDDSECKDTASVTCIQLQLHV